MLQIPSFKKNPQLNYFTPSYSLINANKHNQLCSFRRRIRGKKENRNKTDERRSQESDDKDNQYDGIDDQPNEMEGHYTGMSHSDDDKNHQYMELHAVQIKV